MFESMGFWGLKMEPSKTYTQDLEDSFRITMAALPADVPQNATATLYVRYDESDIAVCTLSKKSTPQQPISLSFTDGESVTFFVKGDAEIHLSGNYLVDLADVHDHDDSEEEDEEFDEQALLDELEGMNDEEKEAYIRALMEQDSEDGSEDDFDEEIDSEDMSDDDTIITPKIVEITEKENKKPVIDNKKDQQQQKRKVNDQQVEEKDASSKKQKKEQQQAINNQKENKNEKNQKKEQQAAPAKKEQQPQQAAPAKKEQQQKPEQQKMPNGLIIEDFQVGKGATAQKGKKVAVRYIGKLLNGKTFDSNTSGSPFSFKLGGGQVIKGWDLGIVGMQVGGTRKLTIPANLAYGSRGAGSDIPPNSTLTFEVKLLDVKN